jgi:hypothetical protein
MDAAANGNAAVSPMHTHSTDLQHQAQRELVMSTRVSLSDVYSADDRNLPPVKVDEPARQASVSAYKSNPNDKTPLYPTTTSYQIYILCHRVFTKTWKDPSLVILSFAK